MPRVVRPTPVVLPEREHDLQYTLREAPLSPYQDNWDSLLATRHLDVLWDLWTWVALSPVALTERSSGSRQPAFDSAGEASQQAGKLAAESCVRCRAALRAPL